LKISKEFKIGLVVVTALAATFWGFNLLKGRNIFNNSMKLYAVYQNVNGLTPSCPVKVNGYKIGMVEDVGFVPGDPDGRLLVTMRIDEKDFVITKGTLARIGGDLLGSKEVNLEPSESRIPVVSGDTLYSGIEVGLEQQVNEIIAPLKVKVENLISSVDTIVVSFKEIFDDDGMRNVKTGLNSLRATIQGVETAIGQVNGLLSSESPKIANIITNVEAISGTIKNNNAEIKNIIENLSSFSDSLKMVEIKKTVHQIDQTVAELDAIVEKINKGEGTVGELINNPGLYNKLDSAANNLNVLIEDIKANPGDYVHINLIKIGDGKKKAERQAEKQKKKEAARKPDN